MMRHRRLAVLSILALAGCAVDSHHDFAQVQSVIQAQTGHRILWNTGSAEDMEARRAIDGLVAGELTADQAVQVALLNNLELQAAYEDLGIAQADLVQSGLLKNPVISASIRFPGRPHFPVEINAEQEFLDLLFLPQRQKIAEASAAQTRAAVTDAVLHRAFDVRRAFYKLQGSRQLQVLRQTSLEAADASLDAARRLREAGNIPEIDLAREEARAAQARLDLAAAEAQAAEDREALTAFMGLWGTQAATWTIAPQLPDMPTADPGAEGLESLAMTHRPDLAAAGATLLAAARTSDLAGGAALLSGATVGAEYVRDADVKSTLGPSFSAPLPIFDQGQASTARAQAQFRQALDRQRALAVEIRSQVRKAYARMSAARQRAAFLEQTLLPLQQKILEQTQLQYNAMQVGVAVLLQAKQDQLNAGAQHAEALRDYWISRAELEAALGTRIPETTAAAAHEPNPKEGAQP